MSSNEIKKRKGMPKDVQKAIIKNQMPETISYDQLLSSPRGRIFEVQVKMANTLKQAGNELFRSGDYERASQLYDRGLYHLKFENATFKFQITDEQGLGIVEARHYLLLNLGKCLYKLKKYKEVILRLSKMTADFVFCEKTDNSMLINDDFGSLKRSDYVISTANYLCGTSYYQLNAVDDAAVCLERVMIYGKNTTVLEADDLLNKIKKQRAKLWRSDFLRWKSIFRENNNVKFDARYAFIGALVIGVVICIVIVYNIY